MRYSHEERNANDGAGAGAGDLVHRRWHRNARVKATTRDAETKEDVDDWPHHHLNLICGGRCGVKVGLSK